MAEIVRLHLGQLRGSDGRTWPVHGFLVLTQSAGPILVDTGVGGPEEWLRDWRCVNRSVAEALAEHDLIPDDIRIVVNTHLHFDHCGQNAVFPGAVFHVQAAEIERARRESPELIGWFDFMGARFEALEGDADIAPGVRVITTPGHTAGHQCVLVETDAGVETLIGDAAYTSAVYGRADISRAPAGQADDPVAWGRSLDRVKALAPARVHFCHDRRVLGPEGRDT